MKFLAIDPGTLSMGISFWSLPTKETKEIIPIELFLGSNLHTCSSEMEWLERSERMSTMLSKVLIEDASIKHVVVEYPQVFNSAEGRMIASKGDVVKLSVLVGFLLGACHNYRRFFEVVPVVKWKGQLPKKIVNKRVEQTLGLQKCSDFRKDEWDAVGLGIWWLFNRCEDWLKERAF